MAVAGPVAKPHLCIISTGNKHLAGWHWNLAFKFFLLKFAFNYFTFKPLKLVQIPECIII